MTAQSIVPLSFELPTAIEYDFNFVTSISLYLFALQYLYIIVYKYKRIKMANKINI